MLEFAHWFAGHKRRFRYQREKRYHPNYQANTGVIQRATLKLRFRTNRWNYKQGFKDMP